MDCKTSTSCPAQPGQSAAIGETIVEDIDQFSKCPITLQSDAELCSLVATASKQLSDLYETSSIHPNILTAPLAIELLATISSIFTEIQVEVQALQNLSEGVETTGVTEPQIWRWLGLLRHPATQNRKHDLISATHCIEALVECLRYKDLRCREKLLTAEESEDYEALRNKLPGILDNIETALSGKVPPLRERLSCSVETPLATKNDNLESLVNMKQSDQDDGTTAATDKTREKPPKTHSIASSATMVDDLPILESWLLRQNRPHLDKTSYHLCGLKVLSRRHYKDTLSFYTKHLPTTKAEIYEIAHESEASFRIADGKEFQRALDDLHPQAKLEIQRLIDARIDGCSHKGKIRTFEVYAVQPRSRIQFVPLAARKWWRRESDTDTEWVLILQGRTVDEGERSDIKKDRCGWTRKQCEGKNGSVSDEKRTPLKSSDDHIPKKCKLDEAEARLEMLWDRLITPEPAAVSTTP